jgi:hypothetical protein
MAYDQRVLVCFLYTKACSDIKFTLDLKFNSGMMPTVSVVFKINAIGWPESPDYTPFLDAYESNPRSS